MIRIYSNKQASAKFRMNLNQYLKNNHVELLNILEPGSL